MAQAGGVVDIHISFDVPLRQVTTPDGVTHQVPAGISFNRRSGVWTVNHLVALLGSWSFWFRRDSRRALKDAVAVLADRLQVNPPTDVRAGFHCVEHKSKQLSLGTAGAAVCVIGDPPAFRVSFRAQIDVSRRRKSLSFTAGLDRVTQADLDRLFSFSVCARKTMEALVYQGDFVGLNALTGVTIRAKTRQWRRCPVRLADLRVIARRKAR